ncbi:hypothetical protein ABEW34_21585 [Paenibacillus algorifonticola]|uniref:hypothetical protein n=1 Tax=Paenibacillus algorifonticola TaxID=684063 RepID=UPI003D29352F
MYTLVLLVGLVLWFLHRHGTNIVIPKWLWHIIGLFLIFMIVKNISDVFAFANDEAGEWWPLVRQNAQQMSAQLRELIRDMMQGG